MNILGISCFYHDSAACLVQGTEVVAAVEEERLTRRKHDRDYPRMAIDSCLQQGGITGRDVDLVVFYEKPLLKLQRVLASAPSPGAEADDVLHRHVSTYVNETLTLEQTVREQLGKDVPFQYCEHHLSHAASAFYPSPYEEAAILTVDGVGEWCTTAQWTGSGIDITNVREIHYPDSLGMLYSAMTAYLGFKVNNDEYKVMGLASYGERTLEKQIREMIELHEDGSFQLNMDYFTFTESRSRMYSEKLIELLGPERQKSDPITARHMAIAGSLQSVTEEAMLNLARQAKVSSGADYLCMAGGVAYNCVANARVLEELGYKGVWIQPAAGDSGGAVGAALYAAYQDAGKRTPSDQYSTSLGPSFNNDEIREVLVAEGVEFEEFDDEALCERTAELISESFIIGWFQGRMEFGPRALGNRSILANATDPDMKDVLNARVKFREDFRPFAPAVAEERFRDYFEIEQKSPYMLFTPRVRPDHREGLPSITHADGTARVQTVNADQNPRFHRTIRAFEKIGGRAVVINTSFNVNGEPIVCTPLDAVRCFLGTDIDYLVIGNYIVSKPF